MDKEKRGERGTPAQCGANFNQDNHPLAFFHDLPRHTQEKGYHSQIPHSLCWIPDANTQFKIKLKVFRRRTLFTAMKTDDE